MVGEYENCVHGTPRWIPITATIALVAISGAIVLSSLTPGRSRVNPSSVATAVPEPQLVQPLQTATSSTTTGPIAASTSFNAAVSDSLFDHSEDVEFILDPVTVRKGRAHPASRLSPESVRGAQAVITF